MPINETTIPGHGAEHPHARVAQLMQAFAEPNRLTIIHLLSDHESKVADLTSACGLAQSTVSGHLAVLRQAGLVVARPEGRTTWYSLAESDVDGLLHAAEGLAVKLQEIPDGA